MVTSTLSADEIEFLTGYRDLNARYWNYQKRHGVKKWLKQIHAVQDYWVSETVRRKRRVLDTTVTNAVRRRFCDNSKADPDMRGIVFMVMLELWQKPGLVHLIKFRNDWTSRPWPRRGSNQSTKDTLTWG